MDPNNGLSVFNIQNFQRQTLPGIVDYALVVIYEKQRIAILITLSIILSLAVIGNIATIVVNIRRKVRPFFRTCLISLACSDLITVTFQSITYYSQILSEYPPIWLLGDILCAVIPFATTLAILVNSFTLVGIAMDRYIAVVKIIKGAWEPNKMFCIAFGIVVWGLAAAISSPMMTSYFIAEIFIIETDPLNHTHQIDVTLAELCTSDKTPNQYYYTTIFCVIFLPLLFAFLWLNIVIAKEIWNRRRPPQTSTSKLEGQQQCSCSSTITEIPNKISQPEQHQQPEQLPKSTINISQNDARQLSAKLKNDDDVVDQSSEKRSSESNTLSNEFNGKSKVTFNAKEKSQNCSNVQKYHLHHSSAVQSPATSSSSSPSTVGQTSREQRQLRMFRAILFIMLAFFICRLPTWIFLLYKLFNVANQNIHWILQYSFGMLSLMNCVLNPLLYTFLTETMQVSYMFMDKFRRILRQLIFCFGYDGNENKNTNNSSGTSSSLSTVTFIGKEKCGGTAPPVLAAAAATASAAVVDTTEKTINKNINNDKVVKKHFYFSEDCKQKLARD